MVKRNLLVIGILGFLFLAVFVFATIPSDGVITKYNNDVPSNSDTTGTDGRIPLGTSSNGKADGYYAYGSAVLYDLNETNVSRRYKMLYTGYTLGGAGGSISGWFNLVKI
jgi:hypothetical protein